MDQSTNIVLTGFMGTGKTTIGRLLAVDLGFEFVDTDAVISERHGPIADIFAERGEAAFRAIEQDLAAELAERSRLVIATGGRMMLDPANVATLGRNSRVFCLVADPDEIHRRVSADTARIERPLLSVPDPRARIGELLAERRNGYERFIQITTDDRTPGVIAAEIAALAGSPSEAEPAASHGYGDVP
ncbi:MAG: shikimate kinase [Acidimicrobiia bacterium]|nr:shikimate kinase [Acidimicrobiia bacterium]